MTDLPKLQDAIVTAHDALADILEAEQGDTVHYLTLPLQQSRKTPRLKPSLKKHAGRRRKRSLIKTKQARKQE